MRAAHLILTFVLYSAAVAQEPRRLDLRSEANRASGGGLRVRLDFGLGAGACQGSYLKQVDWYHNVLGGHGNPISHEPEKRTYWPLLYFDAEVRIGDRLGFVAHTSSWSNSRYLETSYQWHFYDSYAKTYLFGGRWYWNCTHRKREWYSGAMAGWAHTWSTGDPGVPIVDRTDFAHQLTFIGTRPNRGVGGCFEIGQGYKGFISLGLSVAF